MTKISPLDELDSVELNLKNIALPGSRFDISLIKSIFNKETPKEMLPHLIELAGLKLVLYTLPLNIYMSHQIGQYLVNNYLK